MNRLFNNRGLTLVEVIMTLTILGIVICPMMNLLILSRKINNAGEVEYKSIQIAQRYMEEIKAMNEIDCNIYSFNSEIGCYEKYVSETDNNFGAEIKIVPNGIIYYINIDIISDGEIINSLKGSKIFQ